MEQKEIIKQIDMIFENHKEAGEVIFSGGIIVGSLATVLGGATAIGISYLYAYMIEKKRKKDFQKKLEEFDKSLFFQNS